MVGVDGVAVRVQEWCAGVPRATEGGVRSPSLRSLTESSCGISLPSTALAGAKGHAATIVERHISLKLNTRQTQVKVPSSPGFVMLPGFQGVQSEREVKWELGPADVSLGRREMLHGGM